MILVAVSKGAEGQDLAHVRFGAGFGRTMPRGDYRDLGGEGYKGGWRYSGFIEVPVLRPHGGIRADLFINENLGNARLNNTLAALSRGGVGSATLRMLGGTVGLIYHFQWWSHADGPYVAGGIGLDHVKRLSGPGIPEISATRFTWSGGVGLTHAVGFAAVFAEARYCEVAAAPALSGIVNQPYGQYPGPWFSVERLPFWALTAGVRVERR